MQMQASSSWNSNWELTGLVFSSFSSRRRTERLGGHVFSTAVFFLWWDELAPVIMSTGRGRTATQSTPSSSHLRRLSTFRAAEANCLHTPDRLTPGWLRCHKQPGRVVVGELQIALNVWKHSRTELLFEVEN